MSETRKLAAILAADVAGYSRLTGADEEGTLARIRALRSELIDPALSANRGRVVNTAGDSLLVEFASVVDAVRAAIDVQRAMAIRNADFMPEKRIEFRVGIHVGDVMVETDGDLMGDGVNVAARLEGICEPGGVCLSAAAYEQVRDKLHETFADLGDQSLKNIARPVRAYTLKIGAAASGAPATVGARPRAGAARWAAIAAALVAVLIAVGWFGWQRFAPPPAPAPPPVSAVVDEKLAHAPRLSIIVLPFANLSGDPEQDYFADGLTDDLTTDLTHLPESFVIGRSTAAAYKGKAVDLKQLGRDLGVRYALEGSVRRVGEAITLNAQLISTETGAHIWADRLEGERSRLGELQVEFVSRLANSLNVQLVQAESMRAMRERPTNPDAVDLSMRGWAAMNVPVSPANLNKAIGYFDQALRLDPEYPQALEGKAQAQVIGVLAFQIGDWTEVQHDAEQAADHVLAVQPNNAMAHMTKGIVSGARQQFDAALAEFSAAIASDRNLAGAYAETGNVLVSLGRAPEAFKPIEQAMRLDPHERGVNFWEWYMCHAHAHLAEWEQAIEWCEKSIATNPAFPPPHVDLAAAYGWLGRSAEANNEVTELHKLMPGFTPQQYLSWQPIDNPKWKSATERIAEGLRKAGLSEHPPSYAAGQGSKWCEGVKIAAIVGGWPPGSPDLWSPILYNGYRQAELDLGPSVTYSFAHWDSNVMLTQLQEAIENKVDGVVFMGFRGDAATDVLIDKAFAQGTIVTTMMVALPNAEKKYSSQGMGYVGPRSYSIGFALAGEAAKRAGVKAGDSVFVWGHKGRAGERGQAAVGMIDALEKVGAKIVYEEADPAYEHGSGDPAGTFVAAMKANPGVKAVVTDDAGLTWSLGYFARAASLKPGQVYLAGFDLTPKTVQAIKEGYVNLVFDTQPYLQGYLPILNICLTKTFGFSGLDFNTAGAFVDAGNVDAIAPLVEKSIR